MGRAVKFMPVLAQSQQLTADLCWPQTLFISSLLKQGGQPLPALSWCPRQQHSLTS